MTFPRVPGSGGPASSKARFEAALTTRGGPINHAGDTAQRFPDLMMALGGARKILGFHRMKQRKAHLLWTGWAAASGGWVPGCAFALAGSRGAQRDGAYESNK